MFRNRPSKSYCYIVNTVGENKKMFFQLLLLVMWNAAQVSIFKIERLGVATLICGLAIGYGTKGVLGSKTLDLPIKYVWYLFMPLLNGFCGSQSKFVGWRRVLFKHRFADTSFLLGT